MPMEGTNIESPSSPKRLKLEPDEGGNDRISDLPDPILHHILSSFDMKQMVQTSLLSKRWRHFWTFIPNLIFDHSSFERKKVKSFIEFLDHVLNHREDSTIHKFSLKVRNGVCQGRINKWLHTVLSHNPQELVLNITNSYNTLKLPVSLFTCESLISLWLGSSQGNHKLLSLPNSIHFPRLKNMHFNLVQFSDHKQTAKFFESCPVLECLMMMECNFVHVNNLHISAPKLKQLVIDGGSVYCENSDPVSTDIRVYAPNLISMKCTNRIPIDCSWGTLGALSDADIAIGNSYVLQIPADRTREYGDCIVRFLKAGSNVKTLKLSSWVLKVIPEPCTLFGTLPQFCNLRHLKLETWLSRDCIYAITCLLTICPSLETLGLEIKKYGITKTPMYRYYDGKKLSPKGEYWDVGLSLGCMLKHLKLVKISGVLGCVNELKFLEILLKSSMILEILAISTSHLLGQRKSRIRDENLLKFKERLQTFEKASSNLSPVQFTDRNW